MGPSDTFECALVTRQWIDMFRGWDAAMARLMMQIGRMVEAGSAKSPAVEAESAPVEATPEALLRWWRQWRLRPRRTLHRTLRACLRSKTREA